MRFFAAIGLCFSTLLNSQTIQECRQRFTTYLNFHGSLNTAVKFSERSFSLPGVQGTKEITIYEEELPALAVFFERSSPEQQLAFIAKKGNNKLRKSSLDSLYKACYSEVPKASAGEARLRNLKIAIDPGHFATNLRDAQVEQKYLYFVKQPTAPISDTIKLFESVLTFQTAAILKELLKEQGATVFMSREAPDHTSFGCNWTDWVKRHKQRTLDSLLHTGAMTVQKHNKLKKANEYTLFWEFFRDFDLANRARKINDFKPDVTVIIHYNVDEKNAPWKRHTTKNFSMAFIGGAFTDDNLVKDENKMHFLRMLITDQLQRSEDLSANTVKQFRDQLGISIARAQDASYLKDNCLPTSSAGVFCRNLVLCRKINSVLVYGESLYQDNEKECLDLMRCDRDLYGVKTNERVIKVARSYFDALKEYYSQDKN